MGCKPKQSMVLGVAGLLLAVIGGGCATMPQARVINDEALVQEGSEVEFYDRLDEMRVVSTGDAVRAMSYFATSGKQIPASYSEQIAALSAKKLLGNDFHTPADRALDRGTLAQFIANSLNLPRGLTASIVGFNGRYALRELEFRALIPPSSPNQTVSGPELIGILARADSFRQESSRWATNAPLPSGDAGSRSPNSGGQLVTSRPLPGIELASRSMDAMLLALADVTPQPASAPTDGTATFVFAEVKGQVLIRRAGSKDKFSPAAKGMAIPADTDLRTAVGSSCLLVGPNGQKISFDAYAKGTLRARLADNNLNVTNVDMERGQVGAEIDTAVEGAGQQYDVRLQSPRNTLAIKGTRVALYDQRPFDTEARSFTGTAVFETPQGRRVAFGKRNGGLVTVTGRTPDPTGVALASAVTDPGARAARSDSEAGLIAYYFSRNASIRFDRFSELPTISDGGRPKNLADFNSLFTANLNLGVSWSGNTNINMSVIESPADNTINTGRVLYPYTTLAAQGLGRIPFDHRGGKQGGYEVANIDDVQKGHYELRVQNLGKATAEVHFFVSPLKRSIQFFDPATLTRVESPTLVLTRGQADGFDVFVDSEPNSGVVTPDEPGFDGNLRLGALVAKANAAKSAHVIAAPTNSKNAKPTPMGPVQPPASPRVKRAGR